jgi:hypothetical protein
MSPRNLNEEALARILDKLKVELSAYHVDCCYIPQKTKNRKVIGPAYWISFSFAEKSVSALREIEFSKNVELAEIHDHDSAEIVREFCRSTAAKVVACILPQLPISSIERLTFFLHYDPCLPNFNCTRRIYTVSIYMDRILKHKIQDLNDVNIRNYFEWENSQVLGLFHRWKSRGVRMTEVNEMV